MLKLVSILHLNPQQKVLDSYNLLLSSLFTINLSKIVRNCLKFLCRISFNIGIPRNGNKESSWYEKKKIFFVQE